MSLRQLQLYSEPYAPTGNIGDSGIRKLLGTPSLDIVQTLVREAVQNSCDAANSGLPPKIQFRLRTLTTSQADVIRNNVFSSLPEGVESKESLRALLAAPRPTVLEINDFGTSGLNGPTRADCIASSAPATNFLDFFRNVGSRRDVHHGGGTYGFGKVALYLASKCSAILVDTCTTDTGPDSRRFMASHLGPSYSEPISGDLQKRFTGRHWWGDFNDQNSIVEPLTGEDAAGLSQALGFVQREAADTGTSIMIIDPYLADGELDVTAGSIAEALLWFFWPRLVADTPEERRIDFRMEVEGREYPIPAPEQFPPLDLFAQAMKAIRKQPDRCHPVICQRPVKSLGTVAVAKGVRGARQNLASEASLIPAVSSHIAVMRPVEFVVRYFEGDPLPHENAEWAGVFVASSEDEVERAFASAEPPAHDDWQPNMLPKGSARTFVNVAVREIKKLAKEVAAPSIRPVAGEEVGPSLAAVAGTVGRILQDSPDGGGAGPFRGGGQPGKSKRKQDRASAPVFLRLEQGPEGRVAVFQTTIMRSETAGELTLEVEPALALEGGTNVTGMDLVERKPTVLSIATSNGQMLGTGDRASLGSFEGECEIRTTVPVDSAVTIGVRLLKGRDV